MGSVTELNRRFEIPGMAQVIEGYGALPKVRISSSEAQGEMYLHGGHVTSWKPAGWEEIFFLSSQTRWADGYAIRGGVPICFPWFGGKKDEPQAPAHGFVRTKAWALESVDQHGGEITVSMSTESDETTRRWWPADFRLVHRVTFGSRLSLELVVTNTGRTSLRCEEALHAYYRVGNVEAVRVWGLDKVYYLDKTNYNREHLQEGAITFNSETDRVYLNTKGKIELEDSLLHRRIQVAKQNSHSTVVWNPWVQKAHSLLDLADGDWRQMVCVEPGNVGDFSQDLAPGHQHQLKAVVEVSGFAPKI